MALRKRDQDRLTRDIIAKRGDISSRLQLGWVRDFARVESALVREGEFCELLPVYWIRLHGVLTELAEQYEGQLEFATSLGPGENDLPRIISIVQRAHRACIALRSTLTEDEHIYADYRRQTEVHVWQNGYRLQPVGPKGAPNRLKDTRAIASLGKSFDIEDLDQRLRAFVRAHGSESAIAVVFARKTSLATPELLAAVTAASEPIS